MVKDKINFRARGPNTVLTRQPVQGRANDGGLRIGEMERDGVCAHGMSYFLNESFMVRGDEYYIAVCNKTGCISIYNEAKNLFLSPYADGPIHFFNNPDGSQNIKNLSRFGRSFSIIRVPYSLKLLIQELQVMNVQMRIITDENVDQLLSMSYSNNIHKLLKSNEPTEVAIKSAIQKMNTEFKNSRPKTTWQNNQTDANVIPEPANIGDDTPIEEGASPQYVVPSTPSDYETPSNEFDPWSPKYPLSPEMPYSPISDSSTPSLEQGQGQGQYQSSPTIISDTTSTLQDSAENVTYPYTPIVQEFGKTASSENTLVETPQPSILEVEPENTGTATDVGSSSSSTTETIETGTDIGTGTGTGTEIDTSSSNSSETKKITL